MQYLKLEIDIWGMILPEVNDFRIFKPIGE